MSKQSRDVVVIKEAGEGKMKRIALLILILMTILVFLNGCYRGHTSGYDSGGNSHDYDDRRDRGGEKVTDERG
nr:hypothetical protein [uncultured Desulfobulbus sp.]